MAKGHIHINHQYDLFISYAKADRAWVEGYLLDALRATGVNCHTEAAFSLGAPRLTELERAVQESRRTLLILSPAYLEHDFEQFANLLAQTFGLETATWPVIPLILHQVRLPLRLSVLTALDMSDPELWSSGLEQLCKVLHCAVPEPLIPLPCPYPGMLSFSERDADYFFGRERDIEKLLRRLRYQNYLFIIGPSGSGKSSLVFAGLVPELNKRQPKEWLVKFMRPGPMPLVALEQSLGIVLRDSGQNWPGIIEDILKKHESARHLLLIIDQFEELFAQTPKPLQHTFIDVIMSLRQVKSCTILLMMRADFFEDLMNSNLWPVTTSQRLEISALRGSALRDAITKPAAKLGVYLEVALLDRILADAADEPGALPMVQETMVLLWEKLQRHLLPLAVYEELGNDGQSGLAVAMAMKADGTFADLDVTQHTIARRILVRLVQFGEGRVDTRRQQPANSLRSVNDDPQVFDQVLQHLADNRLIILSSQEHDVSKRVDIAHEALISGWPVLREWLAQWREAEEFRRRLEDKVLEWIRLGRGEGGLLDHVELAETQRWLNDPMSDALGMSPDLLKLVSVSLATIEDSSQAEKLRLDYSYMLVHDLRSPLTNLMVSTDLLLKQISGPINNAQERIIQIASDNSEQMLDLVNALLDIPRLEQRQLELQTQPVELFELVEGVFARIERIAGERHIRLHNNTIELPPICVDISLTHRVLQNLVDNSTKFSPQNGQIYVSAMVAMPDQLPPNHAPGKWALIEVADEGPGVPEEFRGIIFEMYGQAPQGKGRGTGLGLAFCKLAIAAHGGAIWIKDRDEGTTLFRFTLPLAEIKRLVD